MSTYTYPSDLRDAIVLMLEAIEIVGKVPPWARGYLYIDVDTLSELGERATKILAAIDTTESSAA